MSHSIKEKISRKKVLFTKKNPWFLTIDKICCDLKIHKLCAFSSWQKLPLESFEYDAEKSPSELTLKWKADEQHPVVKTQVLTLFSPVNCVLAADNVPLKWMVSIVHRIVSLNRFFNTSDLKYCQMFWCLDRWVALWSVCDKMFYSDDIGCEAQTVTIVKIKNSWHQTFLVLLIISNFFFLKGLDGFKILNCLDCVLVMMEQNV